MDAERASRAKVLADVNERIHTKARDWDTRDLTWEFLCECGRPECHEHVVLTVDGYAALHDAGRAVLAPGHEVSQVARAKQLVADAEALHAQARHQIARSEKNQRDRSR